MTRSRTTRLGAALAAAVLLLVLTPTLAATPPPGYVPVGSWQLLAEANKSRQAAGIPPLRSDAGLAAVARTWAEHLSRTRRAAHNDALFTAATKQRLGIRLVGENVGFDFSVARQHAAFMKSAGHRANILNRGFRTAGVAVVRDTNGHLWSVEVFATPR